MGLFGGGNKKEFVSNGKLFEYIATVGNYSKLEDELEKRYLYRNIEDIQYLIFLMQQLLLDIKI